MIRCVCPETRRAFCCLVDYALGSFGFCDFLHHGKCLALLIPQLEQAQQHLIPLMLKLLDGAVARLLQCSFDNRLLYGRREFGDRSQVLPQIGRASCRERV